MKNIYVNIEDLEAAVENFVYASKEAGEINFRLKQLGTELTADVDLLASPEYEQIMAAYSDARQACERINEFFETLLFAVTKAPELYSEAERKSIDKINAILKRSIEYNKAVVDTSALDEIIQKAKENDVDMGGLTALVNRGYQSVNMAYLAAQGNETGEADGLSSASRNVADAVNSDLASMQFSEIAAAAIDKNKD